MQRQRFLGVTVLIVLLTLGAMLSRPAQADELARALLLPELFGIMAEEGRKSVLADGAVPLQGRAFAQFAGDVERIYQPERMLAEFLRVLEAELADTPEARTDALDFAASDAGRKILQLELAAREALLDDDVDVLARMALDEARAGTGGDDGAQRLQQVRARIDANDLIELNVSLGLNTSFAYYRGMLAENAVNGMSTDMLLQLVWAQEPEIRADIEDWIESYFLMTYRPLSAEEMQDFVAYVSTPLAQEFNRAMFRAFDTVFSEISFQVGRALGRRLNVEEL